MNNILKVMALALFAVAMAGVHASDSRDNNATAATADNQAESGNFSIDRWAEGTIQSIDAKNNKFTLHGQQRRWASEYAKMMKDIHNSTAKLDAAQQQAKADEIRNSYADKLAKARNESEKDGDFTFYTPKDSNGRFTLFNLQGNQASNFNGAAKSLSDLKIGDHYIIGYDAGTLYNYAYDLTRGPTTDAQLENFMNAQMPEFAKTAH